MKQLFFVAMFFLSALMAGAQAKDTLPGKDTTLKEYVGKYTFPDGSFVTSADISLNGDVLAVSSSQGGSDLEKRGKDTFAMTAFEGGMMYFYRNAAGKVAKIKVEVGDILLEGTKDGVTAWINRNKWYNKPKEMQAR